VLVGVQEASVSPILFILVIVAIAAHKPQMGIRLIFLFDKSPKTPGIEQEKSEKIGPILVTPKLLESDLTCPRPMQMYKLLA
jgi:hypothetical protein